MLHHVVAGRLAQVAAKEVWTRILRESVRLSGIRQEPLASWAKDARGRDVPELALNTWLMAEAFLQLLASGLGALILVSATAVVLGGFSTKIKKEDFWYITAIGIIQAAKVVGSISGPVARFFVQFPAASMHRIIWTRWRHVEDPTECVGVATIVPILFAAAPIVAALVCLFLSIIGLDRAVQDYGVSDTDPKRGNMKPALIVFFSLVLAQGTLFLLWCVVWMVRSDDTLRFSREYFGIGNRSGKELVDRYVTQTQDKCIEKGVFSTTNRTLVSFAAELLQSEYRSDHVSAVSVLRVLTTRPERLDGVVEQICSSEQVVQVVGSLFKLLVRPKRPLDLETKVDTAEILTKLACNLRLTDIPGAAHSISSLLDPHPRLMKMAAKAGHPEPPAPPRVTHPVESIFNAAYAGCRRLLTELKKCVGLRANDRGGEPSRQGETHIQTNNTNQGGAEPQPIVETQVNIANSDATGPAHRRPIYSLSIECFLWLLSRLLGSQLLSLISNRGGAEPSSPQEIQIQTSNTNEGGARDKPLIVHGLMILDKLASDPGNCTEICKTTDLMPKILAPLTHGLLNTLGNDPKTIQIVKASLRLVGKLTSGTCESSSKLRHELVVSENGRTAGNIMWIMRNSSEQEMRILAVEILTRLTFSVRIMRDYIADLKGLFFDPQDSPLRVSAGKALNALAVDHRNREVIWEQVADDFPSLVRAMNAAGNSTVHSALTAELLAQICVDEGRMHRLSSVSNSLSKVLEAIVTTEISDMTTERSKFLASFLCLAVEIGENLATSQAFANAVRGLPMGEKLEEIIVEMTNKNENESEDVICLVITKAAAKLAMWTVSIHPVYAHYFQRENIVDKLQDIVNAMGDLERCVVLRGDADEMEPPYETLQTLVEALESCLVAVLGTTGQAA